MAQLFDKILGTPSGLLGDVVFRRKKGGNIIAKQPTPRASALKDSEKALRAKFGLAGKIASKINSIQVLKDVWPKSTGKGSKCNEILKANYIQIGSAENIASAAIVPLFGFDIANAVLTAGVSGIHLVADALGVGTGIDTSIEKFIVTAGVVVLQTPTSADKPATEVIAFKSVQHNLDLINEVDHSVDFTGGTLDMFSSYTVKKVFACLITLDDAGTPIRYSTTVHS
jgi:hypothetical protein